MMDKMNFILDILKQAVSLLISIGALAAVAFVFREWIKRTLDHYYRLSEARTVLKNQVEFEFVKNQVPMAIELTQAVYKSRNYDRDILDKHTALVQEKEDFSQCVSILTERLYAYRVLLDQDIFAMLHGFKRASQDFLLYLDISDRPEKLRSGMLYFSQESEMNLRNLYLKMDEFYQGISAHFQSKYRIEHNR